MDISVSKFYDEFMNFLTREKMKEYLKLPIYTYILSFALGVILAVVANAVLKQDIPTQDINFEKLGLGASMTWSEIITNNIKVLILFFVSGMLIYIGPIFFLGLNGFVHGLLLAISIQGAGVKGLATFFILMVPHGIFELPALLFGAGAGLILSREVVNLITVRWVDKNRLYEAFFMVLVSFFLFIVASVVETQFTFRIFKIFAPYLGAGY